MMPSRRSITLGFIGVVAAALMAPVAAAQNLPARSNDAGGVRIIVTPKSVGAGANWDFEVTLNTHTKPLDADLTKDAALIDAEGHRYAPSSWKGDPPGGHHRKGMLRFPAPSGPTKSFEVRIQNVGGVETRVFQWTMK